VATTAAASSATGTTATTTVATTATRSRSAAETGADKGCAVVSAGSLRRCRPSQIRNDKQKQQRRHRDDAQHGDRVDQGHRQHLFL
jgi:hypothetical protein